MKTIPFPRLRILAFGLAFRWIVLAAIGIVGSAVGMLAAPPELKDLYPRTKEEIVAKMNEIGKRTAPAGSPGDGKAAGANKRQADLMQGALNELNLYRYLVGVGSDVALDAELILHAQEAAKTIKQAGTPQDGNFKRGAMAAVRTRIRPDTTREVRR
jgi:hypothetical protein